MLGYGYTNYYVLILPAMHVRKLIQDNVEAKFTNNINPLVHSKLQYTVYAKRE